MYQDSLSPEHISSSVDNACFFGKLFALRRPPGQCSTTVGQSKICLANRCQKKWEIELEVENGMGQRIETNDMRREWSALTQPHTRLILHSRASFFWKVLMVADTSTIEKNVVPFQSHIDLRPFGDLTRSETKRCECHYKSVDR
jgi:hypothetical protein